MRGHRLFGAMIIISIFIFSGCATRFYANTNAYTNPDKPSSITTDSQIHVLEVKGAKNPLAVKETRNKISKYLEQKGYKIVGPEKAEYFIVFDYGMGNEHEVTDTIFMYQKFRNVGVGSSSTISTTLYDRWLIVGALRAKDYKEEKEPQPVWVAEVMSRGTTPDIRLVINYLIVAAFDQFGKDTGRAVSTIVMKDDERAKSMEK